MLENFDFTISKFAYFKEEVTEDDGKHIEYKVMYDDNVFEHLQYKTIGSR